MATIGAAVLTSIVAVSRVMPAEPTARPTRATTIGRPALTTEPNASTRMSSAAMMPISSPLPRIGAAAVSGTSPPSSTWIPASRVGSTASSSGSRFSYRSWWVTGTSYWTVSSAVSPSSLSRGGVTDTAWSMAWSRSVSGPVTEDPTGEPSSVCTTTRALALPAPGVCSRSWSMPTWARAAGMSQLSCAVPPKLPARAKTAAATSTQAEIVRQGWAAVVRPRRWRRRDMVIGPSSRH